MALFSAGKKDLSSSSSQIGLLENRLQLGASNDILFESSIIGKLAPYMPLIVGIFLIFLMKKGKK